MRKLLMLCATLIATTSFASTDPALIGTWTSAGDAISLPGSIEFRADGGFTLKPAGVAPASGVYSADGLSIRMALDSSSDMPVEGVYSLSPDAQGLLLQFKGGAHQTFTRDNSVDQPE